MNLIRGWVFIIMTFTLLLAGCTEGVGQMDQQEEKEIKDKAIEYIKDKYNKEFKVTAVRRNRVTGTVYVDGIVKDGKDTDTMVFWEKSDEVDDNYVTSLWTDELSPRISSMINKHMEVRRIQNFVYGDGTKKSDYTGEVPSVFEVLESGGNPDYSLQVTFRIYEDDNQYETGLKNFLVELKDTGFNRIIVTIFVADDELKSASEDVKESSYTLYRYNIVIDDIQKVDIDSLDLDQYKTVIQR